MILLFNNIKNFINSGRCIKMSATSLYFRNFGKASLGYTGRRASNISSLQIRCNSTQVEEAKSDVEQEQVETLPKPPAKVDKSRLLPQHRNVLHNQRPYDEPCSWVHLTEKYQRTMFGRYGQTSGVDPRQCFPIEEDRIRAQKYEQIAYPSTVPKLMAEIAEEKRQRLENIKQREESITKKIEKLEIWKKELRDKHAKKEADALAAKERKERLIEEVRRHFGFKVDPRDERFKEMLEQKEREDKKKQKEAKRKAKEEKLIAKLST